MTFEEKAGRAIGLLAILGFSAPILGPFFGPLIVIGIIVWSVVTNLRFYAKLMLVWLILTPVIWFTLFLINNGQAPLNKFLIALLAAISPSIFFCLSMES